MARHTNKLTAYRIKRILSVHNVVLIGQYDSSKPQIWKQLKKLGCFYIPKNSICRNTIKEVTLDLKMIDQEIQHLFQGPVFFLYGNDKPKTKWLMEALSQLNRANIPLYGGLFHNQLLNFADIYSYGTLLKERCASEKSYTLFHSTWLRNWNSFSNIHSRFIHRWSFFKQMT